MRDYESTTIDGVHRSVVWWRVDDRDDGESDDRLILTRTFSPIFHRTLGFIGINPSTAGVTDDATVRVMGNITKRYGFARLIVGNLYPGVSKDPDDLARAGWPNTDANDEALAEIFEQCDRVIVGWGASAPIPRSIAVYDMARRAGLQPLAFGLTRSGLPWHPARKRLPKTLAGCIVAPRDPSSRSVAA